MATDADSQVDSSSVDHGETEKMSFGVVGNDKLRCDSSCGGEGEDGTEKVVVMGLRDGTEAISVLEGGRLDGVFAYRSEGERDGEGEGGYMRE